MRVINAKKIQSAIASLCIEANLVLRLDVITALKHAYARETNKRAKNILAAIIENAKIARTKKLAICQDTGMPVVFLEIGRDVRIQGDLNKAINKGIEEGYRKASLRNSVIKDPLQRGASGYIPAVIHTDIVKGHNLKIMVLPKGFGCENKSQLKMFKPTAGLDEVKKFIIESARIAGPDACPPYVVGVGIGGTADYAGLLAKKALLRTLTTHNSRLKTLEKELLNRLNKLNIGPMGLGGKATCLAVNIETYPTHIAGLPVAVNISCHALRSASIVL